MKEGSKEELNVRMRNIAIVLQQGFITPSIMIQLAQTCISQYPQFPELQVKYLEILNDFCDALLDNVS